MRYASISLLLLSIFFMGGCQKSDDLSTATGPSTHLTDQHPPVAAFRITNLVADNTVMEGKNLRFENSSKNAVSYHWDFGNGITADSKNPPTDIYYVPCGGNYTITLTIKNITGEVAVYSQSFSVLCSGRNSHGTHLPD